MDYSSKEIAQHQFQSKRLSLGDTFALYLHIWLKLQKMFLTDLACYHQKLHGSTLICSFHRFLCLSYIQTFYMTALNILMQFLLVYMLKFNVISNLIRFNVISRSSGQLRFLFFRNKDTSKWPFLDEGFFLKFLTLVFLTQLADFVDGTPHYQKLAICFERSSLENSDKKLHFCDHKH